MLQRDRARPFARRQAEVKRSSQNNMAVKNKYNFARRVAGARTCSTAQQLNTHAHARR